MNSSIQRFMLKVTQDSRAIKSVHIRLDGIEIIIKMCLSGWWQEPLEIVTQWWAQECDEVCESENHKHSCVIVVIQSQMLQARNSFSSSSSFDLSRPKTKFSTFSLCFDHAMVLRQFFAVSFSWFCSTCTESRHRNWWQRAATKIDCKRVLRRPLKVSCWWIIHANVWDSIVSQNSMDLKVTNTHNTRCSISFRWWASHIVIPFGWLKIFHKLRWFRFIRLCGFCFVLEWTSFFNRETAVVFKHEVGGEEVSKQWCRSSFWVTWYFIDSSIHASFDSLDWLDEAIQVINDDDLFTSNENELLARVRKMLSFIQWNSRFKSNDKLANCIKSLWSLILVWKRFGWTFVIFTLTTNCSCRVSLCYEFTEVSRLEDPWASFKKDFQVNNIDEP